ncbi:MAG: glycosyltransferase family 2 protein [Desulfobaccales bacterium]
MEKFPLVSICIPAYNAERYITDTLESVLRQDYANLEIIVSDDRSTDHTPEIVQAYERRGVRLIRQAQNLGMTANMNAVIAPSRGKYVVKLDGDDLLEPKYVSSLVPIMESHPRVSFAHCACYLMDGDGKSLGYERSIHGSFIRSCSEEWPRYVFGPRAIHILMVRRTAFEAVGGYDESFIRSQDWKLMRDLLKVGDICYDDRLLARYRHHSAGKPGLQLLRAQAHLQHLDDMEKNWPPAVPGKARLLHRARRHLARWLLVQAAAQADRQEALKLLHYLPQYGNFLDVSILGHLVRSGGSGIILSYYRQKIRLRQAVKKLFYKSPDLAGQTAIVAGPKRKSA